MNADKNTVLCKSLVYSYQGSRQSKTNFGININWHTVIHPIQYFIKLSLLLLVEFDTSNLLANISIALLKINLCSNGGLLANVSIILLKPNLCSTLVFSQCINNFTKTKPVFQWWSSTNVSITLLKPNLCSTVDFSQRINNFTDKHHIFLYVSDVYWSICCSFVSKGVCELM
ncbi:hypothetical protein AOLI_G00217560 [Acnodon oligacanthus]